MVSNLRMQWSAEDGIDLLTGVAVPLRAYFESMQLVRYTGDEADVYPGFTRAVLPSDPDGIPSALDRWPNTAIPLDKPLVGTIRSHILRVDQSDRDVSAIVCRYDYAAAEPDDDGQYVVPGQWRNQRDPNSGISAYLVTMLAPEYPPQQPLPPQKGPDPAPAIDVFGNWTITGYLNWFWVYQAPEWPNGEDDLNACIDRAPDPPEHRQHIIVGPHPRETFPTEPAWPGWPAQPN
ncbi:hypothetical protein [Mycolicibacterium thermoresistibile]